MNPNNPELKILLLVGGKSQRMGKDKAGLEYEGKTQLERMVSLVAPLDLETYLSVRKEQGSRDKTSITPIYDHIEFADIGPMGGMLSAFQEFPTSAFLVIACDLPFLTIETLEHLINNRDGSQFASAYRSSNDGLPEPLCAIWEPASREVLKQKLSEGIRCPRKILIQGNLKLLDLPKADALDNINTPEEYKEAQKKLSSAK